MDKKELGMYDITNPSSCKVKIGEFTILPQREGTIWIQTDDGEGAEFDEKLLESAVDELFNKHF